MIHIFLDSFIAVCRSIGLTGKFDCVETLFLSLVIGSVVMSSILNLKHSLLMGYIICERT